MGKFISSLLRFLTTSIMPNPLTPELPALPPDHLYQLVAHGKINRKRNSTYQYEMLLHFVVKSARDGFHQPVGEVISSKASLLDTYDFVCGSLWDAAGHRISAGMYMLDEGKTKTYPLFSSRCHFRFGGKQAVACPLTKIIPASSLPKNPLHRLFLTTAADNWVLPRYAKGTVILISCFELLRVLYYETGPGLIEHYLRNQDLSVVCTALEAPTAANQHTGRIRLHKHGFTKRQQDILAELCFNPHYLRNVTAAHSNLTQALLRTPEGATPQLDFLMGRPLRLEANGFHFKVGKVSYFFVCGLWAQANPFSFHKLLVVPPPGRQPVAHKGNKEDKHTSKATQYQTEQNSGTPLDSRKPGSSRYRDATVRTHDKQGVDWPTAQLLPSKKEALGKGSTSTRIPQTPESLSYTPGGSDETRALVTQIEDAYHEPQLTSYFQDFVDWFRQRKDYQVELLQLHNEDGRYGPDISLLGKHDTRRIGVAQLRHANGYFYFCEFLSGGRAAFIHQRNAAKLDSSDFEGLFAQFKRHGLNWLQCKKNIAESDAQAGLTIHPRNRHNGGIATALVCDKTVRSMNI